MPKVDEIEQTIRAARILIIDDVAANIEMLSEALEMDGYANITGTTDPKQALTLIKGERRDYDLVLLDMRMPEIDGHEFLRQAKAMFSDELLPVVVLTAQTDDETRRRALAAGVRDFVTKPFILWELLHRVRNTLELQLQHNRIRALMEHEAEQRRSAQTRLIDALESAREAMVLVDRDDRIVIANKQLAQFLPRLAARATEGAPFTAAFAVPSGEASASDAWRAVLSRGGELQLADGRWVRVSRTATRDGGFFLFISDITEIKEREESYRRAKRDAEAASAAKSNFLANMSHELRTPLNVIIGFSEIIANQIFGAVNEPRYVDYARDILQSGEHLLAVVESVLDMTKSEAGKLKLASTTVDLRDLIGTTARMLEDQCARAQLRLAVRNPGHPVLVACDPAKLRQILLNLLSNAIKFSEPGGTVTLEAAVRGDEIEIKVIDTGIGMRAEDIPVALEPFGQIETALSRRHHGAGLGLPLTAALVELHGGRLRIDSEIGRGTTVTVGLPRLIRSGDAQAVGAGASAATA